MEVANTTEMKQKLNSLQGFESIFVEFGKFLSTRLNPEIIPEIIPQGFIMAYVLAVNDAAKGIDDFTGLPIKSSIVGYPPIIYNLMLMQIPEVAEAVCPPEFAAEVKSLYQEMK